MQSFDPPLSQFLVKFLYGQNPNPTPPFWQMSQILVFFYSAPFPYTCRVNSWVLDQRLPKHWTSHVPYFVFLFETYPGIVELTINTSETAGTEKKFALELVSMAVDPGGLLTWTKNSYQYYAISTRFINLKKYI